MIFNKKKYFLKIKLFILFFLIIFITNVFSLSPEIILNISDAEISHSYGGFTNTTVIGMGEDTYYFKECKNKLPLNDEIKSIIEYYFDHVCESYSQKDVTNIVESLKDIDNFKKFTSMGVHWNMHGTLYKYLKSQNSADVGLSGDFSNNFDVCSFIIYASRELNVYYLNRYKKIGEYQDDITNKCIATREIAKLFGLEHLIVKTLCGKITSDNGINKTGMVMESAKDMSPHDFIKLQNYKISPLFQRDSTCLQILDIICRQVDHMPYNYFVKVSKDNQAIGINAFDNDTSFLCESDLTQTYHCVEPLIKADGKINLPHVDKQLANKILSVTEADIQTVLENFLNVEEIKHTKIRFNKIKQAIDQTIKVNDKFLLDTNEWNNETLEEELSGKYGETYLKKFSDPNRWWL